MTKGTQAEPRIAVIIPCLNEAAAIATVVADFARAIPTAAIHVYDNGSTDHTAAVAHAAGAIVAREPRRGKGNVVRRMFADVDADIYVLVDGDQTYDAASAPAMVARLLEHRLDMVTGVRGDHGPGAYRPGHRLGGRLLTQCAALIFRDRLADMLSGYRVMSRRFVKSFPGLSSGFEIETELSVHALSLRLPTAEMVTPYAERPAGSASKLRTYADGWRILMMILKLAKDVRPLLFFGMIGALLALLSIGLAAPLLPEYLRTGLVPRFPTAILSTGLMILACLATAVGLVLDLVARNGLIQQRLAYLAHPPPPETIASGSPRA